MLSLWDTHTADQICQELGCTRNNLGYIVAAIRKIAPERVLKKHNRGYIQNLILEVLK